MTYDEEDKKPEAKLGAQPGEAMTDEELHSTVNELVQGCINFVDEQLSPERATATEYYLGKPFGNEKEGRSQIVNTEVRDHVNGAIPSVIRVFFGPEQVCEFVPPRPGTEATAEAMTKSVRYVFTEDNPGFMQTLSVLKDGMIRKLGVFKYWWEDGEVSAHVDEGVSMQYVENLLMQDPSVEPTKVVVNDDDSVDFHYTRKVAGRVVIRTLPPEEFLYNPEARDAETAMLLGHRTHQKRGDLIAMGIDEKVIDEHGGIDMSLDENLEELARRDQFAAEDPMAGEANDDILYIENYMRLDVDGKGLILRKICTIGPNHFIVDNEPADFAPFALFCPDPEPHTLTGRSWADRLMDLQLVTSSMVRAMNDSLSLAIFPRTWYVEGQANPKDILNTEIGAPIRLRGQGMAGEFAHTFVGKEALPILGFFREIAERRTGQSNATTDLDMDALQSTTKSAADAAIGASQQHVELMARIFAEQTLKPLFKGIARLLKKHQKETRMIRVKDQWVEMSPAQWDDMEVSVRVALGSMLVEKKLAILDAIGMKQENILTTLGPSNPLVHLSQLRNTYARAVELSGFPDASEFFQVVPPDWQPEAAPQQPSPEMIVAQIEQGKLQLATQTAQITAQHKQQELALREQEIATKAALERESMQQKMMIEEMKIQAEMQLEMKKLELEYQTKITTAAVESEVDAAKEQARLDAERVRENARLHLDAAKHDSTQQLERERIDREHQLERERLAHDVQLEREKAARDAEAKRDEKQEKAAERDTRKQEAAKPVVVNIALPKRGKTKVTRDKSGKVAGFEETD